MLESTDTGSVNSQIRQLQEENQQLKQRVAYVSPCLEQVYKQYSNTHVYKIVWDLIL